LSQNREIARAYLKEAAADVNSARLLIAGGEYSQTIVHCQHAVEKTLKAALAMRNIIITREHIVSPEFVRVYSDWDEAKEIGLAVSVLEKEGTRTEYAFFGRPDLPIWIPSERYGGADAEDALAKAEYVFEVVGVFLRETYEV